MYKVDLIQCLKTKNNNNGLCTKKSWQKTLRPICCKEEKNVWSVT